MALNRSIEATEQTTLFLNVQGRIDVAVNNEYWLHSMNI